MIEKAQYFNSVIVTDLIIEFQVTRLWEMKVYK